ncbi:MAG: hypothetical protein Q7V17_06530 [Afipia sp.]|nr:hypothetical protein [Afipia sp.]
MRIDAGSYLYQNGQTASATAASSNSLATAPVEPAAAHALSSGIIKTDFTGMTRQQLSDWMNDQIRSGAMSLDESTAFLGMTLRIDAQTMQPVDMASDTMPVDFVDKAKQGIAGALSRGDRDGAAQLQAALATMQRYQGQVTGVDIRA